MFNTFKRNPFKPLGDKEKEDIAKSKKDSIAEVEGAITAAKECLKTEHFKRYKDEYLKAERKIIDGLIEKSYVDPVQDAFFMREQLARLSVLKQLIVTIESDASRNI